MKTPLLTRTFENSNRINIMNDINDWMLANWAIVHSITFVEVESNTSIQAIVCYTE